VGGGERGHSGERSLDIPDFHLLVNQKGQVEDSHGRVLKDGQRKLCSQRRLRFRSAPGIDEFDRERD